jgi:2-methylisocitrate lyase-like PEP mutase family enzyme
LFLPNAWDFASALLLSKAGFEAIGTTSLGIAANAGVRDASGAARDETVRIVRRLVKLPVAVTVDLEWGFGERPDDVADLADELSELGVVGINLEDGRPDETLVTSEEHAAKIRAVKARTPDLFVNARTDTYWLARDPADPNLDETIRRATTYVSAGADGVFVPGALDLETIGQLSAAIHAPLNVLYLPGRYTYASLAAADVARISTGSLLFRTALGSIRQCVRSALADEPGAVLEAPSYAEVEAWTPA